MPYITQEDRAALARGLVADGPGELNYAITKLCIQYCEGREKFGYQYVNDVLGALEGAKLEFYRRFAAPYEDHKIIINGDVY